MRAACTSTPGEKPVPTTLLSPRVVINNPERGWHANAVDPRQITKGRVQMPAAVRAAERLPTCEDGGGAGTDRTP